MAGKFSRLKLIDKILLISGGGLIVAFASFLIFTKRPTRHLFIPKGYSGWVTVHFEEPGGKSLKIEGGDHYIYFDTLGYAAAEIQLNRGWGKDIYYWYEGDKTEEITLIDGPEGKMAWIHGKYPDYQQLDSILIALPPNSETTLWEGTLVEKKDTTVAVTRGRRVNLHFYVSDKPEGYLFSTPELPVARNFRPVR